MITALQRREVSRFGLIVAALSLLWPAGSAHALQGIGISPTSQDLALQPGGSISGTLTIINDGTTDVTYRLYATDYHVSGESYTGEFSAISQNPHLSAVSWFKLPSGKLTIKAREQTNIPYTVTAPTGASVGGHYAAVFVETIPPTNPGGTRIARVDRIGTLFYLAVGGQLKHAGEIVGLDIPWLQATTPIKAGLRLRNTGNVHYTTEGTMQLATPFGTMGRPAPFKGTVLPGTTRRLDVKLPAGSPLGLYKVTAKVNYLERTETVSRWLLLMPRVTFLILSGTLLLLLLLGFIWFMRRLRRRS